MEPGGGRERGGAVGGVEFGRLIREARRRAGLTLAQLAEAVSCDKSYLSRIENGRVSGAPSGDLLARLERALSLWVGSLVAQAHWHFAPAEVRAGEAARRAAAAELARVLVREGGRGLDALYKSGDLQRLIEHAAPSGRRPADAGAGAPIPLSLPVEVPVINRVAAGYPREFTDLSYPARVADAYVRCPDLCDPDAFAARVVGDSMEPSYREGDIVVFSPARSVTNGMDCFARLEPDHETTFKRVYFERGPAGEELIRLQPLNPAYSARLVPREQVAGLYAAVSFQRVV